MTDNDRTCPVCKFNEAEYNKGKSKYDHMEWLDTDESVHYQLKDSSYAGREHVSSDMLICPQCGVMQVSSPTYIGPDNYVP